MRLSNRREQDKKGEDNKWDEKKKVSLEGSWLGGIRSASSGSRFGKNGDAVGGTESGSRVRIKVSICEIICQTRSCLPGVSVAPFGVGLSHAVET